MNGTRDGWVGGSRAKLKHTVSVLWPLLGGVLVLAELAGWAAPVPPATSKPSASPVSFEPNLPLVFLGTTNPIATDVTVPGRVRVQCPERAACGTTNTLAAQVRFHGSVSLGFAKKSFAFALDAPARLLDLRIDRNWILNAAYIDRSLMRHKLAYDLFGSLASTNSARFAAGSRFVELFLNGRYRGVYLLMERLDRRLFELGNYTSNDVAQACIYKAIDHAANFAQGGHAGYDQREPDPLAQPYWQPLDELTEFVSSASDTEFFRPEGGIGSRLDLDNAIDFHLLVLVTANGDGITKNYFLARDGQASRPVRQRFFFAPWDYDGTFGRNWAGNPFPHTTWLSNHLFDRLLGHAPYRARFVARWMRLREREFSAQVIQRKIDDNARTLGEAVRRNATRWPTNGGGYPDQLTFAEDIAQMKSWIEARIQWLDGEIQKLSPEQR
jgi:spore coat protein H